MKKEYALYKGDELLIIGTIEEIAKHQNISVSTARFYRYPCYKKRRINSSDSKILIELENKEKEYAFYKGDELLCIGTIAEIAEHQNANPETIKYYGYPSYKKRIVDPTRSKILIEIDDKED